MGYGAAYYDRNDVVIHCGDAPAVLGALPDRSVHCCVTSPPYWGLRDYGVAGQLGLEPTPEEYVTRMVEVFREVWRVLRDDGTCWINLGDAYAHSSSGGGGAVDIRTDGRNTTPGDKVRGRMAGANTMASGLKSKDLCGIPWRVAFALQADGWYLRSDIIWHKPNPMPESVTDRPTKSHEYLFLLSKSERYYYDAGAIAESAVHAGKTVTLGEKSMSRGQAKAANIAPSGNGNANSYQVVATRNKRSVWTVASEPYPEAHFATFPTALIEPCIKAGCPKDGTVLDPFGGSGTTAVVARRLWRRAVLIELNEAYCEMAARRVEGDILPMEELWSEPESEAEMLWSA